MWAVVVVEVVSVDHTNHIVLFGQTVTTQVITFFHDYRSRGGLFIMLLLLVIQVSHLIVISFLSLLLVPSGVLTSPPLVSPYNPYNFRYLTPAPTSNPYFLLLALAKDTASYP